MLKRCDIEEAISFFQQQGDLDVMDQSMLNALTYLESHELRGHVMPEYGRIELRFSNGGCPLTMIIEFDPDRETCTASIKLPMNCVKEKRASLGELLHRINYITVLGEWELDPSDGECGVKYTHFIGDMAMSVRQAERLIDITLMEAHRYEDTIIPLMMGREPDPNDACEEYRKMMTGDDEGGMGFRRMLLEALKSRRKHADATVTGDAPMEEADAI